MKEKTCLNLGCGKTRIPGFVNIDQASHPHVDKEHQGDIRFLDEFKDGTADLIYCCHALQYMNRIDALVALKEWFRVLKPGGILRLAVPDFEEICRLYLLLRLICPEEDILMSRRGFLGPLYGRMEIPLLPEVPLIIYHHTVYDFISLRNMLSTVGFTNIHRYNWRKTEHANVDDCSQAYIPHMDKEHGRLISLNVEATK